MEDTINDLRRRIKYKIAYLTESQKVIANYILENPQKFVLCSVRSLEDELKISKSTIVRSAQALGYKGIYELKSVLLKGIQNNFGPIPRYKTFLSESHEKLNFIKLVADETVNNINNTLQLIDNVQYKKSIDLLKHANHVYTIGVGISSYLAEIATYLFARVSINSNFMTHGALTFSEQIINISKDDVIFAFSFPPYSKETIEAAHYAKEKGIKVISVTDKATSKIIQYSDVFLQVSVESITISNSIMSVLVLLYSIITQIADELKDKTLKTIEAIEHVRKEHA
ncbi:MAG: MurR/RpiR family transcriptional regulator [Thermoleophilia bacterium]|nr:MurR/RpiR family transcriptional regulator [Thermoleophilia bacterium]